METGFSIFRRNFTAQWPFANDLEDIAHYYGQYAQIMRHWDRALPDRVNFVQYEDLIDSFEPELRRLLDGCGLDFEQQCVDYHTVDRTVMTFSATQVRKGPTASHKRGSAAYEHRLEPLPGRTSRRGRAGLSQGCGAARAAWDYSDQSGQCALARRPNRIRVGRL